MAEKRSFPRKRKRLLVDFLFDGRAYNGFTFNVSPTGMFIASSVSPAHGQVLSVLVHLPDGRKVGCKGSVVRSRKVPTSLAQEMPNGFSIQISEYFKEYCDALDKL